MIILRLCNLWAANLDRLAAPIVAFASFSQLLSRTCRDCGRRFCGDTALRVATMARIFVAVSQGRGAVAA